MRKVSDSRSRQGNGVDGPLLISLDKEIIVSGKRMMASSITMKKGPVIAFCLTVLFFLLYFVWSKSGKVNWKPVSKVTRDHNMHFSEWPVFSLPDRAKYNSDWLKSECVKGISGDLKLDDIFTIKESWSLSTDPECRELYRYFSSIFTITSHPAKVVIPEPFAVKVRKWLRNNEALFQNVNSQTIIYIFNEYTREENVFNPLREKRPISVPDRPEREYVEELTKKTAESCDFCNYKMNTAEDVFGRIESQYSFTASNTFKVGAWHTLGLTKSHHPFNWNRTVWLDLMDTCQKWIHKVNERKNEYTYPMMIMDMLPHGGASQVHPHIHLLVDRNRYQGAIENWRIGAEQYAQDFPGRNYFTDLVAVHSALGLSVTYGKAVAFASLVVRQCMWPHIISLSYIFPQDMKLRQLPKKDNEMVIVSEDVGEDYFNLVYFVIRAFLDDMDKLCYSSGYGFPTLDKNPKGRIPAYTRIITRGPVADVRSDISSLELFTSQNANTNPYKVIDFVRKSVQKRSKSR